MTGIMFARVHARAVRAFARAFTFAKLMPSKVLPCFMAAMLSCALVPAAAFAEEAGGLDGAAQVETGTLAASLMGQPVGIVKSDVVLDSEPVIGSFTADGLTYTVKDGYGIELVGVASNDDATCDLPETVAYDGAEYVLTAVAPYAFYLSGVTGVALPASVASVDNRAFRSSDVASVQVAEGNPAYASSDGVLYSADLTSLLLIPEGRSEGVRIPYTAEEVPAEAFSHVSAVGAISVDADSPTYSSEDGLLYSADGTVLLRVPAGAADITIRDGCTTIAAGAMEGCAALERIHAPASVISISPDVFTSILTVSLPATSVLDSSQEVEEPADSDDADVAPKLASEQAETQTTQHDEANPGVASSLLGQLNVSTDFAPQLTAMVALSTTDDDLPEVDPSAITVSCRGDKEAWRSIGFAVKTQLDAEPVAATENATVYGAASYWTVAPNYSDRGYVMVSSTNISGVATGTQLPSRQIMTSDGTVTVKGTSSGGWSWNLDTGSEYANGIARAYPGYTYKGWSTSPTGTPQSTFSKTYSGGTVNQYAIFTANPYTIRLDANGSDATVSPASIATDYDTEVTLPVPTRPGYRFAGWNANAAGSGTSYTSPVSKLTTTSGATVTLYAQWERVDYDLGFDVDSEPGDEDYAGEPKDDQTVNVESGPTPIEDPKRPGYVFEGWVIPSADGTEAIDQELVYQDDDGKWYVDASKLPDYAGDDGRVELTARWTSIISVDVPNTVTFYADMVTQGQESREGRAEGAFGQNKVESRSEVDLRVVGLESSAVATTGDTLGADSVLKKADAATPSTSAGKLLSLYPSPKAWTEDELQDPDATGGTKDAAAVDFDLDDILLEASFAADAFTIPAGDTLNMGYRLNLTETGRQLDYDKLSTLEDGQSAAIANVSYCFSADVPPSEWNEPLWVKNEDPSLGRIGYYLLDDIKAAADDLSANGTSSEYYDLYKGLLDAQVMSNGNPGAGPYFQLLVDGAYLPVQLIGICQDTRSDNGKPAGLTFQMRDVYAYNTDGSDGSFDCRMNEEASNDGGWESSSMRARLQGFAEEKLPSGVYDAIAPVDKGQQLPGAIDETGLQLTSNETVWIPSAFEVFGRLSDSDLAEFNVSESLVIPGRYTPFQYQAFQGNDGTLPNVNSIRKYGKGDEAAAVSWWLRSTRQSYTSSFCRVYASGMRGNHAAINLNGVLPCFCL